MRPNDVLENMAAVDAQKNLAYAPQATVDELSTADAIIFNYKSYVEDTSLV